jgi:hypothetical protein
MIENRLTNPKHGDVRAIRFPNYESATFEMIDRLAAYEDTSLTPEEITVMQEENASRPIHLTSEELNEKENEANDIGYQSALRDSRDYPAWDNAKTFQKFKQENAILKKALELVFKTFCTKEELKPSIDYWMNDFIQQAKEAQDGK